MDEDSDEDKTGEFPAQAAFLQEVRERAKVVSKNARDTAEDVIQSVKKSEEEGDAEVQSYLIKIRAADTSEENEVPKIVVVDSENQDHFRDIPEVQISPVRLNLSAEYAKMGLAQKGRRRRKPKVRWTVRGDIFEGVAVQQDVESDDEGMRSEESRTSLSTPRQDNKRHSAPVFSNSLMADLGSALNSRKPKPELDSSNESISEECSKIPLGMPVAFKVAVGPVLKSPHPPQVSSAALVKNAAALKKTEIIKEKKETVVEDKKAPWMKELGKKREGRQNTGSLSARRVNIEKTSKKENKGEDKQKGPALPFQVKLSSKVKVSLKQEPEPVNQNPPWKNALRKRETDTKEVPPSGANEDECGNKISVTDELDDNRGLHWASLLKGNRKTYTVPPNSGREKSDSLESSSSNVSNVENAIEERCSDSEPEWKKYLDAKRKLKDRRSSRDHSQTLLLGQRVSVDVKSPGCNNTTDSGETLNREKNTSQNTTTKSTLNVEEENNVKNTTFSRSTPATSGEDQALHRTKTKQTDKYIESSKNNNEYDLRSVDVNKLGSIRTNDNGQRKSEENLRADIKIDVIDASSQKPLWMQDLKRRREDFSRTSSNRSDSLGSDDGKTSEELMEVLMQRRKKVSDAEQKSVESEPPEKSNTELSSSDKTANKSSDLKQFRLSKEKVESSRGTKNGMEAPCEKKRQDQDVSRRKYHSGQSEETKPQWVHIAKETRKDYQEKAEQLKKEAQKDRAEIVRKTSTDRSDKKVDRIGANSRTASQSTPLTLLGSPRPSTAGVKPSEGKIPTTATRDTKTRKSSDVRRPKEDLSDGKMRERVKPEVPPKNIKGRLRLSARTATSENSTLKAVEDSKKFTGDQKSLEIQKPRAALETVKLKPKEGSLLTEHETPKRRIGGQELKPGARTVVREASDIQAEKGSCTTTSLGEHRRERRERRSPVRHIDENGEGRTSQALNVGDGNSRLLIKEKDKGHCEEERQRSPLRERREKAKKRQTDTPVEEGRQKDSEVDGGRPRRIRHVIDQELQERQETTDRNQDLRSRDVIHGDLINRNERNKEKETERSKEDAQKRTRIAPLDFQSSTDIQFKDQNKRMADVDVQSLPDKPSKGIDSDVTTRLKGEGEKPCTVKVQDHTSTVSEFRSRVQHARDVAERHGSKADNKPLLRRDRVQIIHDDPRKTIISETKTDDRPDWLRLRRSKVKEGNRKREPGQGDWV